MKQTVLIALIVFSACIADTMGKVTKTPKKKVKQNQDIERQLFDDANAQMMETNDASKLTRRDQQRCQ